MTESNLREIGDLPLFLYKCNRQYWNGEKRQICNGKEAKWNIHYQLFHTDRINMSIIIFYAFSILSMGCGGAITLVSTATVWLNLGLLAGGAGVTLLCVMVVGFPFGVAGSYGALVLIRRLFLEMRQAVSANRSYLALIETGEKAEGVIVNVSSYRDRRKIIFSIELSNLSTVKSQYIYESKATMSVGRGDKIAVIYSQANSILTVVL
jgi:hypothetical protein